MCGIAGILHFNCVGTREVMRVERMLSALSHRGPDGRGMYQHLPALCMGAVRLAIKDRFGSRQPLANTTGSIRLVYNGEIYNHSDLRRRLIGRGHTFNTDGDGEVIIHLYQEDPTDFAAQLDGMFAFALWDEERQRLVLGRDRCGIKPLYYLHHEGRLSFASEVKALVKDAAVPLGLNREAVEQYLSVRFAIPPGTVYAGIKKVEPGSTFMVEPDGGPTARRFWDIGDGSEGEPASGALPNVLRAAVATTSLADSDVGVLLSGGIDSSAVAGLLAGVRRPKSFSVGYEGSGAEDERRYARRVAEHLRLAHREVCVGRDAVPQLLAKTIWHLEEPVYTPVIVSTYAVSQLAGSELRIALSGDGSDELLFGYHHFRATLRAAAAGDNWRRVYLDHLGWHSPRWLRLICPEPPRSAEVLEAMFVGVPPRLEPADQMRWFEFHNKLPEYHLNRVDRLSMAHGLEVRVPFLRNDVVAWAFARPGTALLSDRREKAPLREAVGGLLPASILRRRKQKFTSPYRDWLDGALKGQVPDLLLGSGYHREFGLNRDGLHRLVLEADDPAGEGAQTLWGWFILFYWYERVFRDLVRERAD
jgi:asparagine synthase (glutamine-hydrolysing)